jgi:zinc transporter ZupT
MIGAGTAARPLWGIPSTAHVAQARKAGQAVPGLSAAPLAIPALASAFASALAGMLTLVVLLTVRGGGQRVSPLVGSFAAAALLSATLLHLWPEASMRTTQAGVFTLTGLGLVYLIATLSSVSGARAVAPALAALAPLLGIGAHSFLDGALHATVFAVDLRTGLTAAPGLVLHEISETALLYVLMLRAGFQRWSAGGLAFLGAVATTPLGALASVGPIASLSQEQLGWALAATAGSLLYMSVAHLAETQGEAGRAPRLVAFAAGVALAAALWAAPWSHVGAPEPDHAFHTNER